MEKIFQNKKRVILAILLFFVAFHIFNNAALAQVQLETALPTIQGPDGVLQPEKGLPEYINYLFIFGLGLIAILALAQMMVGGITYILAAGNVTKVEDAKNTIQQALLGLGLLLVSYLLLKTINPDLVNLRAPNLAPLKFKGVLPTTPTDPNEPPQSGRPSVLLYNVTGRDACANIKGQEFYPCKTYCLATPGLCNSSTICCGTNPNKP